MLQNVRIVLVRPQKSGNVGAVCRAMMNMGLEDLTIVAPECDVRDEQAEGFAMRAKARLGEARIVPTVAEALDDCQTAYATTGKGGFYRKQAAVGARKAAVEAIRRASTGPVAVAFGPEDQGFALNELLQFDRVVEIPANPEYPAMNLAAAAAVICYELRQAALAAGAGADDQPEQPTAPHHHKEVMFAQLFDALDRLGYFYNQQRFEHLQFALRHLLGRCEMTINEADILIGIAKQMHYYADHYTRDDAPSVRHRDRAGPQAPAAGDGN